MSRLPLIAMLLMLTACSSQQVSDSRAATAALPVADTVLPKLAPQSGVDPTLDEPLIQRRCDFSVDLPVDAGWFAGRSGLSADGRIALARAVLGPANRCSRVELVSVDVGAAGAADAVRAHRDAELRAEQIRQFFVSRGIASERIEARAENTTDSAGHIGVEVHGVAR